MAFFTCLTMLEASPLLSIYSEVLVPSVRSVLLSETAVVKVPPVIINALSVV